MSKAWLLFLLVAVLVSQAAGQTKTATAPPAPVKPATATAAVAAPDCSALQACANGEPRLTFNNCVCQKMPRCVNVCRSGALTTDPQSCWNHPDYALQSTSGIPWWTGGRGMQCAYAYPPSNPSQPSRP
jgi:hypothetical protein